MPAARGDRSFPWFGSDTKTGISARCSASARAVVHFDPPMTITPGTAPPVRPSARATGAKVNPCSTTVAATSANASGATTAPSEIPTAARRSPNRPATATRTTPRGPVRATSACSLNGTLDPSSDRKTTTGRATRMTSATNRIARASSTASAPKSRLAAKRIKTPDTSRTVACSLNRRSST